MLFVNISPKQAAQYNYMCVRLSHMLNKMSAARKTLENIGNTSFDKPLAKCVYLLASESLQCENEIRSQIGSLNCSMYEDEHLEDNKISSLKISNSLESLCNYIEEAYLTSYKKLLNDKHFGDSMKDLIQHHVEMFMSSLTQLRLFNDVKNAVN
jgi:hypothetical protein